MKEKEKTKKKKKKKKKPYSNVQGKKLIESMIVSAADKLK